MRKEQLVRALLKIAKENGKIRNGEIKSTASVPGKRKTSSKSGNGNTGSGAGRSDSRIARQLRTERNRAESLKNLALANELDRAKSQPEVDRVILIVRDPYWLQVYWEITRATVDRVRVALAEQWFGTRPVLRLLEVPADTSTGSESVVREIPIHGGVRNWFIDVCEPPKSYCVALGYATSTGKFFLIAKSNTAVTPSPDPEAFDLNWSDIHHDHKRYYAMSGGYANETGRDNLELRAVFEEKMRRPMNVPAFVQMGNGYNGQRAEFEFEVDAHMVIQGKANPTALIRSAEMMLRHLEEVEAADAVHDALFEMYAEADTLTPDVGGSASTTEFAERLASRVSDLL